MTVLTSPSFPAGLANNRSEAAVRAIEARRNKLAADLRAEGVAERQVAEIATDALAETMLDHECRVVALVTELFLGHGAGIK